jgi:predicted DNA-binding transcriptional regulator AlpA
MSVFSTNQARHLYVATGLATDTPTTLGNIFPKADTAKTHLYFEYMGQGGLTRSDLIDIKNIMYAKATKADKMARELKAVTVTLNGNPVGGQDYILKIAFRQFTSPSDADIYTKFGMVHATSGMSASDFYKAMAISLFKNFSREEVQMVKFTLTDSEDEAVPVTAANVNSLTKEKILQTFEENKTVSKKEIAQMLGIKESDLDKLCTDRDIPKFVPLKKIEQIDDETDWII